MAASIWHSTVQWISAESSMVHSTAAQPSPAESSPESPLEAYSPQSIGHAQWSPVHPTPQSSKVLHIGTSWRQCHASSFADRQAAILPLQIPLHMSYFNGVCVARGSLGMILPSCLGWMPFSAFGLCGGTPNAWNAVAHMQVVYVRQCMNQRRHVAQTVYQQWLQVS